MEQLLHLGEQLTGLSPTVCRRIIAAIRERDAKEGGEKRETWLHDCRNLICLLIEQMKMQKQTGYETHLTNPGYRAELLELLHNVETFLDIVEGKSPTK